MMHDVHNKVVGLLSNGSKFHLIKCQLGAFQLDKTGITIFFFFFCILVYLWSCGNKAVNHLSIALAFRIILRNWKFAKKF